MKSLHLLNVRIDQVDKKEALSKVLEFLRDDAQHTIFTPNAEMMVEAQNDDVFLDILNKGSLNISDGMGAQFFSKGELTRLPGVDFMQDICKLAEEKKKKVYLLGSGSSEVIQKAKSELQKRYPDLHIVGFHHGPKFTTINKQFLTDEMNEIVIDDIIDAAPDILFVGFGQNKQERWIHEHLKALPSVKVAMGVGGAFDMIGGKRKRAPKALRELGLESFWRLLIEPTRLRRVFTAVIIFPILYIKSFIKK
jgi:N-acetylglucosaminyldiphosphoundecaprenol N-acetyl-beta-D-mannosaminyltransferase